MSKHSFLMVTDITTNTRVAIPIKRIVQIKEYKHTDKGTDMENKP